MRRLRRRDWPDARSLVRLRRIARICGRAALITTVVCVLALVAVQIAGVVMKNVAVAHELSASRGEIEALRTRQRAQQNTIVRLSDPRGALPEIHDKLHVVGNREEIIYVRGVEPPSPAPGEWRPQP